MTPVRLEPAALRSRVKHSTTEPLRSLYDDDDDDLLTTVIGAAGLGRSSSLFFC